MYLYILLESFLYKTHFLDDVSQQSGTTYIFPKAPVGRVHYFLQEDQFEENCFDQILELSA